MARLETARGLAIAGLVGSIGVVGIAVYGLMTAKSVKTCMYLIILVSIVVLGLRMGTAWLRLHPVSGDNKSLPIGDYLNSI